MTPVDAMTALLIGLLAWLVVTIAHFASEYRNAREVQRSRRTGWRLQDDIKRLERELGIEEDA